MTEYRSRKTVKAIKVVDTLECIDNLKELSEDIKIDDPGDSIPKVSIYNEKFKIYIPVNFNEWIVKDGDDLIVMTDDEFNKLYEDMTQYNARISAEDFMNLLNKSITIDSNMNTYKNPYFDKILSNSGTVPNGYSQNLGSTGNYGTIYATNVIESKTEQLSDSMRDIRDRVTALEQQVTSIPRDRMDNFIENYVTPNGN